MAQRSRVPQFGQWNDGEDVAYSFYFEKARERRGGLLKMTNPNDPQENAGLFSSKGAKARDLPLPPPRSPPKARVEIDSSKGRGPVRMVQVRRARAEDSDVGRFHGPSVRNNDLGPRNNDPRHQQPRSRRSSSSETRRRPAGQNAMHDYSAERSPLQNQAKVSGSAANGGGNGSAYGRTRPRQDEKPGAGAAVPRFGDWNVNDPASGSGYTSTFNRVRGERQRGPTAAASPGQGTRTPLPNDGNRNSTPPPPDRAKVCCFPWMRS